MARKLNKYLSAVNGVLDEAKSAGLIARSIEQAGLRGVDVAPPGVGESTSRGRRRSSSEFRSAMG